MRYQIGDKVKIRDDLEEGEYYYDENDVYSDSVNETMVGFCGYVAVITGYSSTNGYRLDIDGSEWNWMDEMFIGRLGAESYIYSPFQSWENSISQ